MPAEFLLEASPDGQSWEEVFLRAYWREPCPDRELGPFRELAAKRVRLVRDLLAAMQSWSLC